MSILFANKNTGVIYKWKSDLLTIFDDEKRKKAQYKNFKKYKICKFNNSVIREGNAISIIYRRIKIVSDKFDRFGSSQIMITNNIVINTVKDSVMDNVVFYDKNIYPITIPNTNKKYHVINNFNNKSLSDICYYSPGFMKNNIITITTKIWEVDDSSIITKIMFYIKQLLCLIKFISVPIKPYLTIADTVLGKANNIISNFIRNKELCDSQTIEFSGNNINKPIMCGYYVCLPGVNNINTVNTLTKEYYLEDNTLVKKDNDNIVEYDDSYIVIEVCKEEKENIYDYEFTTHTNNLINNIVNNTQKNNNLGQNININCNKNVYLNKFIEICKEKEDFRKIKKITQLTQKTKVNESKIKSLYNHLNCENKQWLRTSFPSFHNKI